MGEQLEDHVVICAERLGGGEALVAITSGRRLRAPALDPAGESLAC